MEIFRTDGGGKTHRDERLCKLLVNFCKTAPHFIKDIEIIRDHKGHLMVVLNDIKEEPFYEVEITIQCIYNLFNFFWLSEYENELSVFYKNKCVIGNMKGETYS